MFSLPEPTWKEDDFLTAYKTMATKQGLSLNPDDPEHYYDYRTLYKETGKLEPDETGHFPSEYKLEGHPNMIVEGINTKTGKLSLPEPGGLQIRGEITQTKVTLPEPGTVPIKSRQRFGGLKQGIDTYGIGLPEVQAPTEDPLPNALEHIIARIISPFERALVNIGNLGSSITGVTPPFKAPITGLVQKKVAWEQEKAKKEGNITQRILWTLIPSVEQLLVTIGVMRGLGGLKAANVGTQLGNVNMVSALTKPFAKMAAYRFISSEGTPAEKLHQSAFTVAASLTPLIINTTGATGFTAVLCDTMLNMVLSNKTYTDALKNCDNLEDFIVKIVPQLTFDFGLAFNTRGGTVAQQKAAWDKYQKQAEKTLTLKLNEFTDLVKVAKEHEAKEKSIDRKLIPKFPSRQWQVTDEKSLTKLGNAIAKEVGFGETDIVWRFVTKGEKGTRADHIYTGANIDTGSRLGESAVITIFKPHIKDTGTYKVESARGFLGGTRSASHGNLVKTILHELTHIGQPKIVEGSSLSKTREEIGKDVYKIDKSNPKYSDSDKDKAITTEIARLEVIEAKKHDTYKSYVDSHFKNDIAYVGKDNNIEIIKNPTSREIEQMKKEVNRDNRESAKLMKIGNISEHPYGKEPLRVLTDGRGNIYIWNAYALTHEAIVAHIDKVFGLEKDEYGEYTIYPMTTRGRVWQLKKLDTAWKEAQKKDGKEVGHGKEFHAKIDATKGQLWKEKETIKESVERRIAEVEAKEKGQPLLIDETDRAFVKDYTVVQRLVAGAKSIFGVQDALKDAGAPETGFHLKNFPGMVAMGHDKGIVTISSITKMAKKIGIAKDDYAAFAEMTYMIESGKYKSSMPKELVEKYKSINELTNKFYKEYEDKFKDIGWLEVPFPQSLINRNEANIKTLQAKLKDAKGIQIKSIQTEIKELQGINARIGEENLSFVSVPIRMILRDNDAAITKHFMSLLPKWGRKTITIRDLVEEGVLTEKEADIRSVIGEYTNRMSKKYALGLVFKAAEDEGLITPTWKQPNWDTFDEKISPQLKGKKVNPILNNLLIAYISAANSKTSNYQQIIGLTKMMQFYNPLFLPMYDVVQAAAAGTFTSLRTPINFVKGIHDVLTKTKTFWAAQEDGIFSKPFYLKEDAYTAQLNKHLEKNTLLKIGKKIIPSIYTLSWNTAWTMDAMVRMMTYRHFVSKGMSSRESAQTAAMFHGDYASLPPNTRKFVNQFLFTPTFKISMGKLGANMVKSAIKTAFDYKGATKTDKAYAAGLVRAYGILAGIEAIMHHWGYETEEKFRKYSREVETEDGVKESVITFAHPLNLLWRYAFRGAKAYEPDVQNKFDKLCEQAEYELTPLYNIALKVRRNKYDKIYNPNDDPDKQIADAVKYSMREIVAISKMVFASEEEQQTKKETYKVLKDQLGNLTAAFLTPFVFHYLRDIKDVRLKNRIIAFKKANAGILDQGEFETDEEYFKRYDNYLRKLDALYEQY